MSVIIQQALLSGVDPCSLLESHGVHYKPHNGKASDAYDQIAVLEVVRSVTTDHLMGLLELKDAENGIGDSP